MRTADRVHRESAIEFYNYEIANGGGSCGVVCEALVIVVHDKRAPGWVCNLHFDQIASDEEWRRFSNGVTDRVHCLLQSIQASSLVDHISAMSF